MIPAILIAIAAVCYVALYAIALRLMFAGKP